MKSVTKQQKSTISLLAFLMAICAGLSVHAQIISAGSQTPPATVGSAPNAGAQTGQPIPGQYIVVLKKNAATELLQSKAPVERKQLMRELAVSTMKRNGLPAVKVEKVYGTALIGFAVSGLSQVDAEKLRRDAQVAYVEQDQVVSLSGNLTPDAKKNLSQPRP